MKRCEPSEDLEHLPDWYWTTGLHDAVIVLTEALEPPYGRGLHALHNCLKLHLDARGARESDVRCIALYDYRLIEGVLPQPGGWWLGDKLRKEDGKYVLEVSWTDNEETYSFAIRFGTAEVERQ